MNDVFVRYLDLPVSIKGMTVRDNDGFFNIYLNSRLTYNSNTQTLQHELAHIKRGHFDRDDHVLVLEREVQDGLDRASGE
jgi:uncharacterized protein YjaZ